MHRMGALSTHVLLLYSHRLRDGRAIGRDAEISADLLCFTICRIKQERRLVGRPHVLLLLDVGLLELEVQIGYRMV